MGNSSMFRMFFTNPSEPIASESQEFKITLASMPLFRIEKLLEEAGL